MERAGEGCALGEERRKRRREEREERGLYIVGGGR